MQSLCSIINEKLLAWYRPNYEQAGFRAGQGCLNQIFILSLLITHSKRNNKKLYVCFIDYEKAFDFANRPSISNHLMNKGCGKFLTSAITKTIKVSLLPQNNKQSIRQRYWIGIWSNTRS